MKPIPITSCHKCNSDKWEVVGKSKYYYKCEKCEAVIQEILKKRRREDE